MKILKCCKGCSGLKSGMCSCTLPDNCNEYVDADENDFDNCNKKNIATTANYGFGVIQIDNRLSEILNIKAQIKQLEHENKVLKRALELMETEYNIFLDEVGITKVDNYTANKLDEVGITKVDNYTANKQEFVEIAEKEVDNDKL